MIHNDHLATPQKITDSSGTVVWSADYKPFGEANVTVSTITNNLRFPGQYYDAETGLHQNWYRDYNLIGRYIEADPIGILYSTPRRQLDLVRGLNHLYGYVGNNPLNKIDTMGLDDGWPWYGGWPWNGSIFPGYSSQDNICSYPFGILNKNSCTKKCCKKHDECYKAYGCNFTSWAGTSGACQLCNSQAVSCVLDNLNKTNCDCPGATGSW